MGFESCHPAVNFFFFTLVLFAGGTFTHPVFLAIGWVCAFAYSVKRSGWKVLLFDLLLLPLAALYAVHYACCNHFGVTVWQQNFIGNNLTVESVVYGLVEGLRIGVVCMWCSSLFRVFSSDKVVYLFGRISPRLSLFLTILLRLVPRLKLEAQRINLAQQGIGRGVNQGNILQRLRNCLRIFSMLITWLIQALALEADSMKSRGSNLRGRTAFSIYRFDNRDRAFVLVMFTATMFTALAIALGACHMVYNPRILWKPLTWFNTLTALGYAFVALMPLGQELWIAWRFSQARRNSAPTGAPEPV